MARKVFRKLVRDLVPAIIRKNGESAVTKKLSVAEFKKELLKKLQEEVGEAALAKTRGQLLSELADVEEVLAALYTVNHIDHREVTAACRIKRKLRGAFAKRIFLVETK